ncbi:MAG: cytidine deaminase [Nanoarchaeota archaeon]
MKTTTYKKLSPIYKKLLDKAEQVMKKGYSPYTNFYVGSALLTTDNKIYSGSNIETASYVAICAERAAISKAVSEGKYLFKAIAVISKCDHFDVTKIAGPCGICRQLLYEFSEVAKRDIIVINSTTKKDKIIITKISELMPLSFGPKDTKVDVSKYRKNYQSQ